MIARIEPASAEVLAEIESCERAGFVVTGRHVRTLPGLGHVDFVDMEERC